MTNPRKPTLPKSDREAPSAQSLLVLVRDLCVASHTMTKEAASAHGATTLVKDIGDNLVEAVQALSELTDALVDSPHIHQAVVEAHEESRARTDLCDLSTIVSMDIDHSKLRYFLQVAVNRSES